MSRESDCRTREEWLDFEPIPCERCGQPAPEADSTDSACLCSACLISSRARHALDSSRQCPACGQLAELRYDATQILHDGIGPVRAHLVTCELCGSTSSIDPEPAPELTDLDLLTVIARRPALTVCR